MTKLEYYSVIVPNKPGNGAQLLSAFKEAGVNFVGIWGYPVAKSKSRIDIVAEDPALLKKAAKQLKIGLGKRQTAFHITGEDHPGALAEVLARLAAREWTYTRPRPSAPAMAALGRSFRWTRTPPRRLQKLWRKSDLSWRQEFWAQSSDTPSWMGS